MPKIRKRSEVEEANLYQSSEVYRSKLRKLDCRKNNKPNLSDIANKPVPSENKIIPSKIFKLYCKGRKKRKRSFFIDVNKFLKKPKSKAVQTTATNCQELITQFCENCNRNLRALDCSRDRKLETQQENKATQTDVDLSRKENPPTSEIETVFRNSSLEYNAENKSSANDVSTAHCTRDSVDQNFTQDDSEIISPEYSPIRHTEVKVWLETNRAKFDLPNSASDSNILSEGVVDNAKYIPTEKHGGTSNEPVIPVISSPADRIYAQSHQGEKADEGDLKIDIQKKPEFAQIESNTLEDSNSSKKTIVKEILHFPTVSKKLLTEKDNLADFLSSYYLVKKSKIVDEKIDPVFCKAPEENTFEIKNSLDEKKRCPRYAISLKDISNKHEYHEFPIPILKPIQNHQLPAKFTLHVEKYFFIENCPVVKCLSYLHRFPNSSPTNVWTFLCPTPSKICLPNFILISTALTPLPVLYNKNLYKFFENFMNIYSELKVGDNFILLNLLTDNESPISTAYPLQFSTEHENIISTALFNKLVSKINQSRPTVIMETESIESSDFDHPCLFKKFGNFRFASLNIINLKEFSSERQLSISLPFTVQKDSCSCMFADRKITLACPIKSFLLALTNNIQIIQSLTHSAVRPLEGIHTCALQKRRLSPKLDVQKISKQLKSKKGKITRNPCKVIRLKNQESKISVGENIALRTVERKKKCQTIGTNMPKVKINVGGNIALRTAKRKGFQTIGTNMPKVKRSKTQTNISFDENILPLNFIKENPTQYTVANPRKLKYSEKEGMISIDGNMQVLSAAPGEFPQSISPKTVAMAQFPEMKNLFVQKCISLPSPKSKNIEHPLVSNSEIKLSTCPLVSKASENYKSQILLRTMLREYSQNKTNLSMVVDENLPLCLVQKSNTRYGSMQVVSNHSAAMVIRNNKNVRSTSHSSFELNNLEDLNSESPVNTKLSIPNDISEFVVDLSSSSQNSATLSISNLDQNMTFKANNIQASIKTINTEQIGKKSEQIGKKLNTVAAELINSKSLSCHNITLSNSPTNSGPFTEATLQHDCVKFNLLGFMEVHFFEPIKGRNPNLRLLVRIPNPINTTVRTVDKMHMSPNAVLFQSQKQQNMVKTFLHVRKITSIAEIEGFIFDHENTSAPINGFDKQTFIFQPTTSQKMPPKCEFENLRRLNDSFLPKGMYLLTPVRKNGAGEIEIYKKLKNNHLSELKTEIGVCYNLGKECVEVEDLLNIPDHLFFASNVQLTDIF